MALIFCYSAFSSAIDALQVSFGLSNNSCLFVLFQQIIDYKKRQYRGEVLRPTAQWHYSQSRRQALFVSRQLKVLKKTKTFLQRIKQVLPQGMPEALLHPNSANPTGQTIPQGSTLVTHSAMSRSCS